MSTRIPLIDRFFRSSSSNGDLPVRVETYQLIASKVDYDRASLVASADQRKIIIDGQQSPHVIDQIGAAVMVRQVLAEQMGHEELVRYVQHLQGRYQAVVGDATFARYNGQVPKDVLDVDAKLRAELGTLSYRLRLCYSISYIKDQYLSKIRMYCGWALLFSFLAVIAAITYQVYSNTPSAVLNFVIVAFVGFGGALTSISRRANQIVASNPLDDDPIIEASAIQNGSASLVVAALTGPIFATILLVIFMTGGFSLGDMTPIIHVCPPKYNGYDFEVLNYHLCADGYANAAKIVFWSFLAGFAEQFVPDVLDRFSKAPAKKA